MRILLIGTLAALFFSSTFVLNRAMSLEGGHWLWSAALRYLWMILLLASGFLACGRARLLADTLRLYVKHWFFWTLSGCVGFGVFYAGICFSAAYAPGWVVAATWQTTILATPLVLLGFGKKIPLRAMALTLVIFAGVVLVNLEQTDAAPVKEILLGALPVLLAAFAYPLGNQLVWEAREGSNAHVPQIQHAAMENTFCRVLLLTLGSLPLWLLLTLLLTPPPPSIGQIQATALVALLSGVVATSLFLYARHKARTVAELAATDCTQSMEVVFSLAGEAVLLQGALPGIIGWLGITLTVLGLVLYIRVQNMG